MTTFTKLLPSLQLTEAGKASKAKSQAVSQHLQSVLESTSDAFYCVDQDWRFTYLNPQAIQLLEGRSDNLIGKNVWEEFPESVGSVFEESYRRAVLEQVTVSFEAFYPAHDKWYAGRAYPVASGLTVYFQDVTQQKLAEVAFLQHEQTAEHRLTNLPEGLSSAAGMKKVGRSPRYIFGVWGAIALTSGIAALVGYVVFRQSSEEVIAATTAVAAGAILAMLADTMIPEAFESAHDFAGLTTVCSFLASFILSKLDT